MTKIRYVGSYPEVFVPLPDGTEVVVEHNHQVEVPDDVAKGLLEQAENWAAVESKASKKKDGE